MRNHATHSETINRTGDNGACESLQTYASPNNPSDCQRQDVQLGKEPDLMANIYKKIGNRLVEYRKTTGTKRSEVCDFLGISQAMLFKLEKGNTRFPLEWLMRFCQVYKISLHELLPEECFYGSVDTDRETTKLFDLIIGIESLPPRKRAAFIQDQQQRLSALR